MAKQRRNAPLPSDSTGSGDGADTALNVDVPAVGTTEDPTVPGVEPADTADADAEKAASDAAALEAEAAEAAKAQAEADAAAAAAAAAAAEAAEAERVSNAIREAAAAAEAVRAAKQAQVDHVKGTLRNYFNNVRRATREDAVEWMTRMHEIDADLIGTAFDQLVSESGFDKQTVDRAKMITVQVDEFFLRS